MTQDQDLFDGIRQDAPAKHTPGGMLWVLEGIARKRVRPWLGLEGSLQKAHAPNSLNSPYPKICSTKL